MADTGYERVKRHRHHARGDHSLCRPERCAALRPDDDDGSTPTSGAVEASVEAMLEPLVGKWPESDPRQVVAGCAMRLAEAIDSPTTAAGSLAGLVRELNVLLEHATEAAEDLPNEIDGIRARRAVRRLGMMVGPETGGNSADDTG